MSAKEEHHDVVGFSLAIHLLHGRLNALLCSLFVEQQRIFHLCVLRIEPRHGLCIIGRQREVIGCAGIVAHTHRHKIYFCFSPLHSKKRTNESQDQ